MKQESMVGCSSQLPSTSRRCSLRRNGFHPFLIASCLLVCMFCCSRMSNGGCVLCSLKNSASGVDEENDTEGVVSCKPQHAHSDWIWTLSWQIVDGDGRLEGIESPVPNGSSSPNVEISPPLLDWGAHALYSPSLVFLSGGNYNEDDNFHIYDVFNTDTQFHWNGFENMSLIPGESASISFVFLPLWLGFSEGFLVAQTNFSGSVINVTRSDMKWFYRIEHSVGLVMLTDRSLNWTFTSYVPSDIQIEEVTRWKLMFYVNINHSANVVLVCSTNEPRRSCVEQESFLTDKERLTIKSGYWGVPRLSAEALIEMDFWPRLEGEVFESVCIQLLNSSSGRADAVTVPIKEEVHARKTYHDLINLLSVLREPFVPSGERSIISYLCIKNDASCVLSVEEICEITKDSKLFEENCMKGLILYPKTIIWIPFISFGDPHKTPFEFPSVCFNREQILVTNSSAIPNINMPCHGIVGTCIMCQPKSSSPTPESSYDDSIFQQEKESSMDTMGGPIRSVAEVAVFVKPKLIIAVKADELILRNWMSQGSTSEMTELEDSKVLFLVVQMRTYFSKGTILRNTIWKPGTRQIVMHSGAVDDKYKSEDGLSNYSFMSSFRCISPRVKQKGFSTGNFTRTKAFVHPLGSILVVPICVNLFYTKTSSFSCSNLLSEEIYSSTDKIVLKVLGVLISESRCGLRGPILHSFTTSGEPLGLPFSSEVDFSAAMFYRDVVDLVMYHGSFAITLKSNCPFHMPNFCWNSFFLSMFWSLTVMILSAVIVACMVFIHTIPNARTSESFFYKKTVTSIRMNGKSSRLHRKPRKLKNRSVGEDEKPETCYVGDRCSNCPNGVHDSNKAETVLLVDSTDTTKTSQGADLSLKIIRERSRRRKKRASRSTLAEKYDVSSSQSGNSTPSSGPCWHSPGNAAANFLLSASIAPHARAPGFKFVKDATIKREENDVLVKELTYDIWGNHFSDLFFGRRKELMSRVFDAPEGDSQSFFAIEPHSLMIMPLAQSVTPGHKLHSYNVNCLYQMD